MALFHDKRNQTLWMGDLEPEMDETFVATAFLLIQVRWHCGPEQPKIQTEVLGHSPVRSLAPLTRSLAPPFLLRSRALLRSFVRSLAHFTHFLARGK